MFYKPLLLAFFFVNCSIAAFSQATISGRITNSALQPVLNASIVAANLADSTVVKIGISDSDGAYKLEVPTLKGLFIKISAEGYVDQQKTLTGQDVTVLIDFSLERSSGKLNGVTISAQKPLLERRVDRMIFNVPASIAAVGSNALEAVKKAPGVLVRNQEAVISLAGKSTVQILIDDRLLSLAGEDLFAYLQAIPSDNIERIEVITTPPAKYDAAGNSGLINIVLKKNKKIGVNGDVRMGYEQSGYGTGLAGGNLNYRKGKVNVYANVSYSGGEKKMLERLNTDYSDQSYQINDPYKRATKVLEYSAGVDYQLKQSGILGIQYTGSGFNRLYTEPNSDIIITDRTTGQLDSLIHSSATATMKNRSDLLNINYVWNIDSSGKKLTLNGNRLWYGSKRNRDYDTQNFYGWYMQPSGGLSRNKNNGVQDISITTAQADVELPYPWANLACGGKFSSSNTSSRNELFYFNQNAFVEDVAVSNEFIYDERVEAVYATAAKTKGKWEMQVGLRGEFTQTKGNSVKTQQSTINQYFNLFPSAYVQYKSSEHNVWNINYSKRIDRPGYRSLDPYRSYSSPYSYVEGNPFLRPSIIHTVELAYTFKSKYNFSAFYQLMPNTYGQVFFVDSATKTSYVRNENYGDFINYGINANASFYPVKPWELQVQLSGFVQQVNARYPGVMLNSRPLPSGYLSLSNSVSLNPKKTLTAQANLLVITKYMNDLTERAPQYSVDGGLKALFFEKSLTVSLSANDVFRSLRVKGKNIVTGQTLDSYFDEQNVRLMINYRIGNKKLKERRERSTGIEEETKRT